MAGHFHNNYYLGVIIMTLSTVNNSSKKDNKDSLSFEDVCLDNYCAIEILELLGYTDACQREIDLVEQQLRLFYRLKTLREKNKENTSEPSFFIYKRVSYWLRQRFD